MEDVEDTDGIDVTNLPLGEQFPAGLLVVQDGNNEPAAVSSNPEDSDLQRFNTNFKFVSWADFADIFADLN